MWELKDCHRSTGDHHQSYSKVTGCRGNKTLTFCDGGYLTIERALRSQMFITGIMKGRELGVGLLMQAHEQAGLRPLFAPWSGGNAPAQKMQSLDLMVSRASLWNLVAKATGVCWALEVQ